MDELGEFLGVDVVPYVRLGALTEDLLLDANPIRAHLIDRSGLGIHEYSRAGRWLSSVRNVGAEGSSPFTSTENRPLRDGGSDPCTTRCPTAVYGRGSCQRYFGRFSSSRRVAAPPAMESRRGVDD
jgi:hypothetical protein